MKSGRGPSWTSSNGAGPLGIGNAAEGSESNERDEMKIFVKVMKTIEMQIKKHDNVRSIKAKFFEEEGISENLQQIFFSGCCLNDDQILADCNVQKHSTLHMFVLPGKEIYVEIPSMGRRVSLQVKPWDTTQNIKAMIYEMEGVPVDDQRLVHEGRILEDSETIARFCIHEPSTLHLIIGPSSDKLQIFIMTPEGRKFTLHPKAWHKVEDVKIMLESMLGFSVYAQKLIYKEDILTDTLTLADCKVCHGSTLQMTLLMQIFVKTWEGKTITILVQTSDSVNHIKEKIEMKLGKPLKHHRLTFSGKQLVDEKFVGDYDIQKDSTIHLL